MKRVYILLLILVILLPQQACFIDPFKHQKLMGIWYCDELSLKIEFNEYGTSGTGTIIIDGKNTDIVCGVGSGGGTAFYYPNSEDVYDISDALLSGYFKLKGKNEMVLIETRAGNGHADETGKSYYFERR